jgi:hypothetical protein
LNALILSLRQLEKKIATHHCQGTRSVGTVPPNVCGGGVGAGAMAYVFPITRF